MFLSSLLAFGSRDATQLAALPDLLRADSSVKRWRLRGAG